MMVAGYATGVVWTSACISAVELARRKRALSGGATGPALSSYTSSR